MIAYVLPLINNFNSMLKKIIGNICSHNTLLSMNVLWKAVRNTVNENIPSSSIDARDQSMSFFLLRFLIDDHMGNVCLA